METESELQDQELNAEMQQLLAFAITKVLDQKSIRESVVNIHQLVVDEIQEQIKEEDAGSDEDPVAGTAKDKRRGKAGHAAGRHAARSRLKIRASKKLIQTLQDQAQSSHNSQTSMLSRSLSRSMSRKGFGPGSEHGLRSQALLQNYIDHNILQGSAAGRAATGQPDGAGAVERGTSGQGKGASQKRASE